jgi:hypothetical protein
VWAAAQYGQKAVYSPPSAQFVRRLGRVSVVFGAAQVLFGLFVFAGGEGLRAGMYFLTGAVAVGSGLNLLRQPASAD